MGGIELEGGESSLDIHGIGGLAADAPADIWYMVHSKNVKDLMAVAKRSGSGRLDISGRVTGTRSAIRSAGNITFDALQTAGYSVQRGVTRYDLAVTGPAAPSGRLNAMMTEVKGGTELRSLGITLDALPGTP